jgi:hypothetical protein
MLEKNRPFCFGFRKNPYSFSDKVAQSISIPVIGIGAGQ